VAVAGVVIAVTGSSGDSGPQFKASTSVSLTAGPTTIERVDPKPGLPTELSPEVRDQILAAVTKYVDEGTVVPLRKGHADNAELAQVFDAGSVTRLGGTDRVVLLDEGLPKVVGKISVTAPPVAITALENSDGNLVFVSAPLELTITAQAEHGTIRITRKGSLVLAPDPTTGWKVTGWTMHVDRSGPGIATTTTAPTPSTTAAT
jgi:hypothetical protein